MKTLLIVESPAKCKKIQGYLGNQYIIKSSFGHLSNLRGKNQGVDIDNNYKLVFDVTKGKQLKDLKDTMKKCDKVILASDEDREGEAIAFHVANLLKLNLSDNNRITFNEITKSAILRALENPRKIDLNLVHAQQARQGLDYLVGFNLSPLLWKSIQNGLSAGRVQSIAVKLLVDKECEIDEFDGGNYYYTTGKFNKNIIGVLDKKFSEKEEVIEFMEDCKTENYKIESIIRKKITKNPPAPFITTTIQIEAGKRFGMSAKSIMNVLQKLYEDGKITYHRTDSVVLSKEIKGKIANYITNNYGEQYLKIRNFKNKSKNSQEAHEAIRPTNIELSNLGSNGIDNKIYHLIWLRTIASQMSSSIVSVMEIMIGMSQRTEKFKAKTEKIIFDGYRKIYNDLKDKNDEEKITDLMENIEKDEVLQNESIESIEKYKQNPPHYSETTLIKKMESLDIGRPSTYADTMIKIQDRGYVEKKSLPGQKIECNSLQLVKNNIKEKMINVTINKETNKLIPTDVGKVTTNYLNENFETIMDYKFTSNIENELDEIAKNNNNYHNVMDRFYNNIRDKLVKCNSEAKETRKSIHNNLKKLLGTYNNKNMYIYKAKYGPVIQLGEDNEKNKKFIGIDNLEITYEEGLRICEENLNSIYPKNLGNYNGKDVMLKKGKYGFYLEYNKKNFKIKSGYNENLSFEEAKESIDDANKNIIKKIGKYVIKNGEYGYYIQHGKTIRGIPKNMEIEELDEDKIKTILETKPKKFTKKRTYKK